MRWLMAFHLIAMVCWFAGLFYLPRLFVYHAQSLDEHSKTRFELMEYRLYFGIMLPSALLTLFFGFWIMSYNFSFYLHAPWMHAKLFLVALLVCFHAYCGIVMRNFKLKQNIRSPKFYRWLNEIPTLLLIGIVILAKVQP